MTARHLAVTAAVVLAVVLAVAAHAAPADAQRPQRPRVPAQVRSQVTPDSAAGRARLEGEIRRGFARAVRQRVGLNAEQMNRLVPLTQRYEQQRRLLQIEERDARMRLRTMMGDERTADPATVDQLLKTLVDVQKRRVQLLESEQRDLGAIMSPLQRAKYMAFQEQIRRRLEQLRQRRMSDGDAPGSPQRQRPLR